MGNPRKLFVNLPVTDLDRSVRFFEALGFEFNPQFCDDTACCMLIGEDAYAMLVTREKFAEFAKDKPVADPQETTQVLCSFAVESRNEVDRLVRIALENGGRAYEPDDHGFMYETAITDPDGNRWDIFWMDPAVVESGGAPEQEPAQA